MLSQYRRAFDLVESENTLNCILGKLHIVLPLPEAPRAVIASSVPKRHLEAWSGRHCLWCNVSVMHREPIDTWNSPSHEGSRLLHC